MFSFFSEVVFVSYVATVTNAIYVDMNYIILLSLDSAEPGNSVIFNVNRHCLTGFY